MLSQLFSTHILLLRKISCNRSHMCILIFLPIQHFAWIMSATIYSVEFCTYDFPHSIGRIISILQMKIQNHKQVRASWIPNYPLLSPSASKTAFPGVRGNAPLQSDGEVGRGLACLRSSDAKENRTHWSVR